MKYEEYRKKVIECKMSGMTVLQWCEREGFQYTTYCTWRKRVIAREGAEKIHTECGFARESFKKPKPYAEYREKVLQCRGSGLPMEQWCGQEDIKYTSYRTWQRRVFEKEGQSAIDNECGRKPHENKDYTLEKINQNPDMCEISSLFRSETKEIEIETLTDDMVVVRCGAWTVGAYGRSLEDVIRAVKSLC